MTMTETSHLTIATGAIPVLLYHSVSDAPAGRFGPFTVSRSQLAAHLDLVLELGYQPITVRGLLDGLASGQLPPRPVVLTFDDGFADYAANAWPILRDRGLTATLYVTAGDLGGRSQWLASAGVSLPILSPREIADLAADGCEIGAHSMTHPHLDCLPHAVAYEEIRNSKDVLEQVLGQTVDTFAYPHGYHSRATKELVIAAGYRSATAVRNALSHADDDRYAIARVTVTSDFGTTEITRVLDGTGVRAAGPRERWQTAVWRQARRLARPSGAGRR
jgi:peptidoglycan/xylan/chitin deacetylase (PgdA/CDA1 family)